MRRSYKIGFSFGLTSGIVTTLGLMVGLYSSTNSMLVVIGGILTIAIADALSDSMGIHMAQEVLNHISKKEVWETTGCTLLCKFVFSSMFIIPFFLLELHTAIIINVLIGFYLIFIMSIAIARERNEKPWKVVSEHIAITFMVVVITYFVGIWIHLSFG